MDVEFVLGLAVLGTFLFGLALPAVGGSPQRLLGWRRLAWFPPLLVAYVAAEDDYAADGRSRWEVYDAEATIAPALALGALAAYLGFVSFRRPAAAPWAALACLFTSFATLLARLQMTN